MEIIIEDYMKNTNLTLSFYDELMNIPFGDNREREETLKKCFFNILLPRNTLYKYISFDKNDCLNQSKLQSLKNDSLWFAPPYTLKGNDPSEFDVNINIHKVTKVTGKSAIEIINVKKYYKELNDLCCLSDRLSEYMWENYANNHSGCCCVFNINTYEMLNPVIYCDKKKIKFTDEMIFTIKNSKNNIFNDFRFRRIATLPFVMKDAQIYEKEHEVRLLCQDIYDDPNGELGGKISVGKKEKLGYKGTNYSYEKCGLSLQKIIVGYNTPEEIINQIRELNNQVEIESSNITEV